MNGYEKLVKEQSIKNNFKLLRQGKGSHEIWMRDGVHVSVNKTCKSRQTANSIMKEAGIDYKF